MYVTEIIKNKDTLVPFYYTYTNYEKVDNDTEFYLFVEDGKIEKVTVSYLIYLIKCGELFGGYYMHNPWRSSEHNFDSIKYLSKYKNKVGHISIIAYTPIEYEMISLLEEPIVERYDLDLKSKFLHNICFIDNDGFRVRLQCDTEINIIRLLLIGHEDVSLDDNVLSVRFDIHVHKIAKKHNLKASYKIKDIKRFNTLLAKASLFC